MDLYSKASYILIASAYKSGSIYSIKPNDGTRDLTYSRTTNSASRLNSAGNIEFLAPHLPRLQYPTNPNDTVTCPGFAVEPTRTNFCRFSTEIGSSNWSNTSCSAELNTTETLAPNGTFTATKLNDVTASSALAPARFTRYVLATQPAANVTATVSVFAKPSGSSVTAQTRYLAINHQAFGSSTVTFILSGTGSYDIEPSAGGTATWISGAFIEPYPNGWYRCSVTGLVGATTNNRVVCYTTTASNGSITYSNPTTTGSLYLWGAQYELGVAKSSVRDSNGNIFPSTHATSFISASTADLARNGETVFNLPSQSITNQFTIVYAGRHYSNELNDFNLYLASGSNLLGFYRNGVSVWNTSSAGTVASTQLTPALNPLTPFGSEYKFAIRCNGSTVTWFRTGSLMNSQSISANSFTSWSAWTWGNSTGGTVTTNPYTSTLRYLLIYTSSLTDAECISLTT